MEYALKERIGKPELFIGRKEELAFFLKWIDDIKQEKSKSTAMLARRKNGKTAIMERLFNITFHKNDGVIPFYYEIKESPMWVGDFCKEFFLTFIYQYIAFKSRNPEYLAPEEKDNFDKVIDIAKKENLAYLTGFIESVAHAYLHENLDILWNMVRDIPRTIAARRGEFIVQMIDEFQFLNSMIYRDKGLKEPADRMAGGYLGAAESKIAPLLVSGSWVGWLMNLLIMMLPARFKYRPLENMSEDEAIEMVFKYSQFFEAPVTDETAYLIAQLSEGSPFYISAILRSEYPGKNLTGVEGLAQTLEFETLSDRGEIKSTWMEYVATALNRVNDKNAKNIVLYLCKNRDREVTRKELLDKLHLQMTDAELENRLKALVKADIIKQGSSNFDYRGVQDNIFDKVFRGVYQKEIDHFEPGEKIFDPEQIKEEYQKTLNEQKAAYYKLQGKYNYHKGYYAEYAIVDQLMYHGHEKNALLKSLTHNLPPGFGFCEYRSVWKYTAVVEYGRGLSVDILARAKSPGDYSIIGEVKNRDTKKFSREEAVAFLEKFERIKEIENLSPVLGFIFSRKGFVKEAEDYMIEKGIAYTDDEQWLEV
ncbi:MAG: hypothetical protein NT166_08080 [Candidatus Aminicenantes bacterium]|nr:hypothetical protein [Candidatus Aminicenantes bacterium]